MKLKYYFRGIGIGIVVTTILFMILVPMRRNGGEGQSTPPQGTESKTVAQLQEDTQEKMEETEAAGSALKPDGTLPAESGSKPQESKSPKPQEDTQTKPEPASEAQVKPEPASETQVKPEPASETQVQPEPKKEEKVRIEISGGQYSDTVSRKLQEAGLVDNAKAFNDYLVQKNYDNSILPGVYEIPKGSTYEEIAVLLTTKVK